MRPIFEILVDGQDITARIGDRLLGLNVTDRSGHESDDLTFTIDNRGGLVEVPNRGVTLELSLGYRETGLVRVGAFVVDGASGEGPAQTMTITAKAADMTARLRAPRTRAWQDITLGEIVGEVATRHGLTGQTESALQGHRYRHVAQTAESDLHLVTRLAHDVGAVAKVTETRLIVVRPGQGQTLSGNPLPAVTITPADCTSYSWELVERETFGSAKAWWHDQDQARRQPVVAGSGDPVFELRRTYTTQEQAQRAAQGQLAELNRRNLVIECTLARANLDLSAEIPVNLEGFLHGIDGDYVLRAVTHSLRGELITTFSAELPGAINA